MADDSLDELELAFQLHVVDLVVAADDVTTDAEAAFVARNFPPDTLAAHGFVDARGQRTARFHEAAVRALAVLPKQLSAADKHALLNRIFDAAVADEVFRLGEGSLVLMASRLLGLSDDDFDQFLGTRREATGVTVEMLDDS